MSRLLTLCFLVSAVIFTVQAVRIKIKLPQDENFHREYQAHRMKRQAGGQTACDEVMEVAREDVDLIGRLEQLDDRVRFWRSQQAREGLEFLQVRAVPGLGGQTVAEVLQVLREEECFPFLIGGAVRDQFIGRTPRDVDVEIDCPLPQIIEICIRVWGSHNCRNSPGSPVGHIGNSSIPGPAQGEDDIDYTSTDLDFYVPLSMLEYTVNMMAYDTNGNDVILDITGNGLMDTCNRHVRIPSDDDSEASWDEWRVDGEPGGSTDFRKIHRAWKLREKSFQFYNEETRDYLVRFAREGIETAPGQFNDFYCDEVFDGNRDNDTNVCLLSDPEESCEGGLENQFDYDNAYAEDFEDFWTNTIEPGLPSHPCDICQLPADTGPCRANIPRYFFNSTSGQCENFTYGGCDGNQNNFETLALCKSSCNPNDCPPYCNAEYCSARATRRALCTIPPSRDEGCDIDCRVTFCHACYYSDEVREGHLCRACQHNPQTNVKCFRRWAWCTRRANHAEFGNPRRRERTQERFKCYEHPCRD